MLLEVDKYFPEAYAPEYTNSASYDLITCTHGNIEPGHRQVIPLGINVKFPEGTYGRIASRTGLAIKHGLIVMADVIEPNYTGELKLVIYNSDLYNSFTFHPGYKIAQLVLERFEAPPVYEIPVKAYYKVAGV